MKRSFFLFVLFLPSTISAQTGLLSIAETTLTGVCRYVINCLPLQLQLWSNERQLPVLSNYINYGGMISNVMVLPKIMEIGDKKFFRNALSRGIFSEDALEAAFRYAAIHNHLEFYKLLCTDSALPSEELRDVRVECVITAAQHGHFDFVLYEIPYYCKLFGSVNNTTHRMLLDAEGERLQAEDLPLNSAIQANSPQLVTWLLLNGADPQQLNHQGVSAKMLIDRYEAEAKNVEVARLLKLFLRFRNYVTRFARRSKHPLTQKLFQACPALIGVCDKFGNTPLHAAVLSGDAQLVKFLLEMEPSLASKKNDLDQKPLILAAGINNGVLINSLMALAKTTDKEVAETRNLCATEI